MEGQSTSRRKWSKKDKHRILLEHCHFLSAKQICIKWHISEYALRKWKKELGFSPRCYGSFNEWVLSALYCAASHNHGYTVDNIIGHLEWMSNTSYGEQRVLQALERLASEGLAVKVGDEWFYNRGMNKGAATFIF
jgi:hypothetical protein